MSSMQPNPSADVAASKHDPDPLGSSLEQQAALVVEAFYLHCLDDDPNDPDKLNQLEKLRQDLLASTVKWDSVPAAMTEADWRNGSTTTKSVSLPLTSEQKLIADERLPVATTGLAVEFDIQGQTSLEDQGSLVLSAYWLHLAEVQSRLVGLADCSLQSKDCSYEDLNAIEDLRKDLGSGATHWDNISDSQHEALAKQAIIWYLQDRQAVAASDSQNTAATRSLAYARNLANAFL